MKAPIGTVRVAVLGAPRVGKSAVTVRFLTKRYIGEYCSDTDMSYQSLVNHEDGCVKLEIVDSSGKARSCGHGRAKRYDADAFLVVYSVTDAASLEAARLELEAISRAAGPILRPVCLMANKMDLNYLRQVDEEEARQLALQYGCSHRQVSAAESHGAIQSALADLLQDVLLLHKQQAKSPKRRKGILGNVSRRLGSVFRRKSLEELLVKKKAPRPGSGNGRRSL